MYLQQTNVLSAIVLNRSNHILYWDRFSLYVNIYNNINSGRFFCGPHYEKKPSRKVQFGPPELKPIKGHQTSAPDYLDV